MVGCVLLCCLVCRLADGKSLPERDVARQCYPFKLQAGVDSKGSASWTFVTWMMGGKQALEEWFKVVDGLVPVFSEIQ